MATDMILKWEWPADRVAERKLVVQVNSVKEADSGFFGIRRSPSLVQGIPDPVELSGRVVRGEAVLLNKTVSLTLPKLELAGIAGGDVIALGLVDDQVCICLTKLDAPDQDISDWQCNGD